MKENVAGIQVSVHYAKSMDLFKRANELERKWPRLVFQEVGLLYCFQLMLQTINGGCY